MSDIDNRIVFMQFDNAAFERRLAETIKSLNNLNKTIENAGKSKGLLDVGKHAKQINFDPASKSAQGLLGHLKNFRLNTMVEQVQSVSTGFLAMSTIAVTALSQITSAAMNAGRQVAAALTMAPITDGLSEYETNMNSIQTIMANTASKGTTMEDVNKALEDLNAYSDKTIYNFAQMARNIGTFTAAGVGLDESVNAIKGIANLSAMSGASAEDASRAMYQLSQALSAGRVTLMDWNSVVNANIGGEIFKKTLFETGKALGTITDVPIDATFEEWEKKVGKFRDTINEEWITGDVLTTALSTFTGDLSRTQLRSLGYTEEQTKALMEQADLAVDAATKVKTFTQLMGTLKEAMGTGWATSFRLIFGNFEEAKAMWSGAYDYLSGIIGKGAEARNSMLLDWKDGGGRDGMISGIMYMFDSIKNIIAPVREAFRTIFPKKTGEDLLNLTKKFQNWAKFLDPTVKQTRHLYLVGRSLGEAFKILTTIMGSAWKTIKQVWRSFSDGGKTLGGALEKFASWLTFLKQSWVDDGGIADFFNRLAYYIINPRKALEDLIKWAKNFFDTISTSEGVADMLGGLGERFGWLKGIVRMLGVAGDWVMGIFASIPEGLSSVVGKVKDFFRTLGEKLADFGAEGPLKAESAGKLIGLGLLGGIFLQLRKMMKDGLPKGDGLKDLLGKLNDTFDGLTDTLSAMQTKLKADALLSIAIAIGVLALAVLLLSSIDADDLTKAFIALGVGMGELVATMQLMSWVTGTKGVLQLLAFATATVILAIAMNLMASAVRRMGELDLVTIGKGLLGIGGSLLALAGFMRLIQGSTSGIVRTGAGLILVAIALVILAEAVEKFGTMEWDVMKQGLIGVGAGLGIIALAMWAMPPGMLMQSAALIGVAIALNILRYAVQGFGNMEWDVMKQGLIGVAAALGIITIAAWAMPRDLLLTAAGMVVMAVALNLIGAAVAGLGNMATGELITGILALAGMLTVLGVAAYLMGNPIVLLGAVAIGVLSAAMIGLAFAISMLSGLSFKELAQGIGALFVLLLGMGLLSVVLAKLSPFILAASVSMLAFGASILVIGFGLQVFATGLLMLADAGPKAASGFIKFMKKVLTALPGLLEDLFTTISAALEGLGKILPELVKLIGELIGSLLVELRKVVPDLLKLIGEVLAGIIEIIREEGPNAIRAFVELIDALVTALADHSESITQGFIDILNGVMNTIAANAGDLTQAFSDMFVGLVEGLTEQVDPMVTAIVDFLVAVLESLADNVDELVSAFVDLWLAIFKAIGDDADDLVGGFVDMLVTILEAILDGMEDLIDAFTDIVVAFIVGAADKTTEIGDAMGILMDAIGDELIDAAENSVKLLEASAAAIETFAQGIDDNLPTICKAAGRIMWRLIMCIPEAFGALLGQGVATLGVFISGIVSVIGNLVGIGVSMIGNIVSGVLNAMGQIRAVGGSIIAAVWGGVTALWGSLTSIGGYVIEGLKQGISNAWSGFTSHLEGLWNAVPEAIRRLWEERSPSRVFMRIGKYAGEGLVIGMTDGLKPLQSVAETAAMQAVDTLGARTSSAVIDAQKKLAMGFDGIGTFNPVIRPELDLSGVVSEARRLGDILDYATINTDASFDQARAISAATTQTLERTATDASSGETILNFEQHNHSPVALPAKVIHRKTKSALAQAKKELDIP